jgi:putative transposase
MARIVALYLEDPCSGSPRTVCYLAKDGILISRDLVQILMPSIGLRAICQKPPLPPPSFAPRHISIRRLPTWRAP